MDGRSDAEMMLRMANAFLELLHPPQKDLTPGAEHALRRFDDANRHKMHYLVPSAQFRSGHPLRAMNGPQAAAPLELLKASLSEEGLRKASDIQKLEPVLMVVGDAAVAAGEMAERSRFVIRAATISPSSASPRLSFASASTHPGAGGSRAIISHYIGRSLMVGSSRARRCSSARSPRPSGTRPRAGLR